MSSFLEGRSRGIRFGARKGRRTAAVFLIIAAVIGGAAMLIWGTRMSLFVTPEETSVPAEIRLFVYYPNGTLIDTEGVPADGNGPTLLVVELWACNYSELPSDVNAEEFVNNISNYEMEGYLTPGATSVRPAGTVYLARVYFNVTESLREYIWIPLVNGTYFARVGILPQVAYFSYTPIYDEGEGIFYGRTTITIASNFSEPYSYPPPYLPYSVGDAENPFISYSLYLLMNGSAPYNDSSIVRLEGREDAVEIIDGMIAIPIYGGLRPIPSVNDFFGSYNTTALGSPDLYLAYIDENATDIDIILEVTA